MKRNSFLVSVHDNPGEEIGEIGNLIHDEEREDEHADHGNREFGIERDFVGKE